MKRLLTLAAVLLLCGCARTPGLPVLETTLSTDATAETTPAETTEPIPAGFDPYTLIREMTTEELVGQMLLARCPSDQTAVADLQQYYLGGYILFGRDFRAKDPDKVKETIDSYYLASKIPPLIAVDEEGGSVCRVSSQKAFREQAFPSPRYLYQHGGLELLLTTEAEKCQLLGSLGINVNLAPVCDIATDSKAFMYDRSLGLNPDKTGECIATMVRVMAEYRIGSALKHFPGYGNNADTHIGIVRDSRSLTDLEENDLVPFQYGIEGGCDAIMLTHTVIECLDAELPASLSPKVVAYLRDQMGFDRVILTDDLSMKAITNQYGSGDAAVMAVLAGNDLLITSDHRTQYNAIIQAVSDGRITRQQLEDSVSRILQWKYRLGLLEEVE